MISLLLIALVAGFDIELKPNTSQCYGQVKPRQDIVKGKAVQVYVAIHRHQPGHRPLNFRVMAQSQEPVIQRVSPSQVKFANEKLAFIADQVGPYNFCIENTSDLIEQVSIKVNIGVAAHDFSDLPTSKELKTSTSLLNSVKKKIQEVNESLREMRVREDELRKTNETIYSRVWGYSICSIGLLIGLSVFQIVYFKTFFKQKKIA